MLLKISGKPTWWLVLLLLCPGVNFVIGIMICMSLAENFGKGSGFGIGLAFLAPIFLPILAFGSAEYNPVNLVEGGASRGRRRRDDDEDDEDEDDRPRRRPRDDDDDDDQPRRRR